MPRLREVAVAALAFWIFYGLFFAPVLFTGLLAPADGFDFYLPLSASPHSPWSPLLFSGFPAAGDPQQQSAYPVAWLSSWLPGGWNLLVLSGYGLLSLFTYLWVQALTGMRWAAVLAAVTAGLCGFPIYHMRHVTIVHSAAWLPMVLCSFLVLRRQPCTEKWIGAALAVAGMILSGHPQILLYGAVLTVAFLINELFGESTGRKAYLVASAKAWACGIGLAAVMLVPMVELSWHSARGPLTFTEFVSYALPPSYSPQLLFPYLFAGSDAYEGFAELTGYVGILPLLLALAAVLLGFRERRTRFFAVVASVALLLVLGSFTPLAQVGYWIPGWNRFRVPARHFLEFTFAVVTLAGLGFTALARSEASLRRRTVLRIISISLVGMVLSVLGLLLFKEGLPMHLSPQGVPAGSVEFLMRPQVLGPLLMGVLSLTALWHWQSAPTTRRGLWLLAVLLLDLGSFSYAAEWRSDAKEVAQLEVPESVARYRDQLAETGQRLTPVSGTRHAREAAPPNLSRLWGVPSTSGFNPLILKRYQELLKMQLWGQISWQSLQPSNQALDLLASRFVMVPRRFSSQFLEIPRWQHVEDLEETGVFENLRAMPRAWLVGSTEVLLATEVLATIQTSKLPSGVAFDPWEVALLEEEAPGLARLRVPERRVLPVQFPDATTVVIRTQNRAAAFLVLSDIYYPGWRVTADGKPLPMLRCNYLLRGVILPAGTEEVRFDYQPWSLLIGRIVTGLTALLLLIAWLRRGNL